MKRPRPHLRALGTPEPPPPSELELLRIVLDKAEGVISPGYLARMNEWINQLDEAIQVYRRYYPKEGA